MERVLPVTLHDENENKDYILDFSRYTIEKAEKDGFTFNDWEQKLSTRSHQLFYFAFLMHQPYMTKDKTDDFLDKYLGGVAGVDPKLWERLSQLYIQPLNTLTDDKEKNARMTIEM